tara:strand:- start:240 stop:473 length:234 start_codon:yes stop_codon:yes gene_type:complete
MDELLKILNDTLKGCEGGSASTEALIRMREALIKLRRRRYGSYEHPFGHLAYEMKNLLDADLEKVCMELDSPQYVEE